MKLVKEQLTEHFKISEFACGGEMIITPEFIRFVTCCLGPFRKWYSRPIRINSGYRTRERNQAVGGVANSLHLSALAVDFSLPVEYRAMSKVRKQQFLNNINNKWFEVCGKAGGFGEVCWYDTYIHLGFSHKKQSFTDKRGK